eukprot:GHUV01055353.1.p1 GENE.GHUV01055353.1~~GHUV01055353.1.p1  ORF type:complete len:235 (+),score=44.53 GHUV01055353.1:394-1098(+)
MVTKLTAARIATAAGCCLVICTSQKPEGIVEILNGARQGTKFFPLQNALKGRKRWLLAVPVRGSIWMDDGAVHAIRDRHKSLFPVGVIKVVGEFSAQDAVSLCDASGHEFARGLSNFDSKEVNLMKGRHTNDLPDILGYHTEGELIHRGNLALLLPGDDHDDWPKKGVREKLAQRLAGGDSRNSGDYSADGHNGAVSTKGPLQVPAVAAAEQLQQQHIHASPGLPPLPPHALHS